MKQSHLVRVGVLGQVGRFDSVDGVRFARGARVICRTPRGLEVGEVLLPAESNGYNSDGELLRRITVQDELLLARLERHRDEAYRACSTLLAERGQSAVLLDVEHLFDGQSLFFYFLGEVTPELSALTAELAAAYETHVQFHQFVETLTTGCGPGCGTEEATGQGCASGTCSSCAAAAACGTRRRVGSL